MSSSWPKEGNYLCTKGPLPAAHPHGVPALHTTAAHGAGASASDYVRARRGRQRRTTRCATWGEGRRVGRPAGSAALAGPLRPGGLASTRSAVSYLPGLEGPGQRHLAKMRHPARSAAVVPRATGCNVMPDAARRR
eukprot:scaffold1535_cov382-Prasinococcus_capsulatus_cf.AAC.27